MAQKTVFISSCTRRQLSRRRPAPYWVRAVGAPALAAAFVCAAILGGLLVARGGM
jgi:hypothetical protein